MPNIYTVTQINRYIKNMFTQDYVLQSVTIQGEISNCTYHSSGHIYFTLKDKGGTLSCIMFAGYRRELKITLREGQQVTVSGNIDVFERDGRYQLYAKKIEAAGEGALFEQFRKLKLKLQEKGLFEAIYKQPIPRYIKRLGVVTAPTGAAIRDIINITRRRNPFVQIILYPALVQGEGAPASIVQGIRALEQIGVDVMIVGRGGGSLEDLWGFNSEEVAQAVFDCTVPIISAVGHETDTTIIDFVSDLRAPTPSAAAELAVFDAAAFLRMLEEQSLGLKRQMDAKLRIERLKLEQSRVKLKALSPMSRIREKRFWCISNEEKLRKAMEAALRRRKTELQIGIERLQGLSPLEKLRQGYSYTTDDQGRNVRQVSSVKPGDIVTIHVIDGRIIGRVQEIEAAGTDQDIDKEN